MATAVPLDVSTEVQDLDGSTGVNTSTQDSENQTIVRLATVGSSLNKLVTQTTLPEQVGIHLRHSCKRLEHCIGQLRQELADAQTAQAIQSCERLKMTHRMETLLEILPAAIIVLDGQGRVQQSNLSARQMLEPLLGGKSLDGRIWRDINAHCFAPRPDDGHDISLSDGKRVSVSTCALEQEPGQIIMLTDQTATREVQQQMARMERLSALGHMLSAVAHQIRTPLSSAMLYAGHLQKKISDQQRQDFSERLLERLQHLEYQLRDMLIFARGELPLTDRCSPQDLVDDILRAATPVIDRYQCDLEWALPTVEHGLLLVNRDALTGALMNLINNAIEWAPKSTIRIRLRLLRQWAVFMVEDSGPGLTSEQCLQIREPFYSTRARGTGLGLAVADAVARAHGGRLVILSRPGKGTRAGIILPLLDPATE